MARLPPYGKVPPEALRELVFTRLGASDGRVIVGPRIGEDAAIIDMGDRVLVAHVDPITGATEDLGWLAVNVAANDVAVRGARPRWLMLSILLREGASASELDELMRQVDEACRELGVSLVGGHSEVVVGLPRSIVVAAMMGEAPKDRYVTTGGARPGDLVLMTKEAAIEGTAILARELRGELRGLFTEEELEEMRGMMRRISVVEEALVAAEVGGVTAMHDATEGGILGALQELAWASGVAIRAYEDRVPVDGRTARLCRALNIDPLRTISSGSLIATVRPWAVEEVVRRLEERGVRASVIGEVVEGEGLTLVRRDGSVEELRGPIEEHLWRALASRLK